MKDDTKQPQAVCTSRFRGKNVEYEDVWQLIRDEAIAQSNREPMLASFFHATIIKHQTLADSLSFILASKLASSNVPAMIIRDVIEDAYANDPSIVSFASCDMRATVERDPAVSFYSTPMLYLKGFHALQGFRVANWLWKQDRPELAIYLQNQISMTCQVDIHPAAKIGCGILLDHATGIVIGETAVIDDDVSILQNVTLGGTGKQTGDRHPKVRSGVLIGANATVLGDIEIGEGAKIAAGSVVLSPVAPHTTVAGVPAKVVGKPDCAKPSLNMDQDFQI